MSFLSFTSLKSSFDNNNSLKTAEGFQIFRKTQNIFAGLEKFLTCCIPNTSKSNGISKTYIEAETASISDNAASPVSQYRGLKALVVDDSLGKTCTS
jgi:hypothetical protein